MSVRLKKLRKRKRESQTLSTSSEDRKGPGTVRLLPNSDGLCERCRSLDVETIVGITNGWQTEPSLDELSHPPDCWLCAFLRKIIESREPEYGVEERDRGWGLGLRVTVLRGTRVYYYAFSWKDYSYHQQLFMVPKDLIFQINGSSSRFARTIQKERADFDLANSWMNYCRNNHASSCGAHSDEQLRGLKVIDCSTKQILLSESQLPYAALSYTWGESQPGNEQPNEGVLPSTTPKTVLDALLVALRLGVRYLWVDRYCIDQNDPKEKHRLISNMDRIYAGAELTIIAAAGSDPSYGLPGVSSTPRSFEQLQIEIGHTTYVSLPPLEQSARWWKRGWAFQEMLLSKRRLVFTPYQMYFQCLETHCTEAVVPSSDFFDPSASVIPDGPQKKNEFSEEHLRLFPHRGIGTQANDIYSRLEEFTYLKLSYSSDTLVAFYGIFNAYRRLKVDPVFLTHFWGIPVLGHRGQISEAATFAQGLLWNLHMYPDRSLKRQGQWPSWSWTSDGNPVEYRLKKHHYSFHLQETIQVSVNHLNGSKVDISDFAAGDYDSSDFHSSINITTWTLRSRLVAGRVVFPYKPQGAFKNLKPEDTHAIFRDYREGKDTDIMAVYLGLANYSFLHFLVIEEAEPGIWKRVARWELQVNPADRNTRKLGPDELRSLLRDPYRGHKWEYKTVRIA